MGLIKAGIGAVGGVLADQWKEFFYCESLPNNVLMRKGEKQTGRRSTNTKGSDNIITNGSGIAVADGQCMIIVEQGRVVDFCAEPGQYTYDKSSEPSVFSGKLSESVKQTFKTIGSRFAYGGDTGKDQRVYYFNTKEILNNKFGTPNPIMFEVVNNRIGMSRTVQVRCNGTYTYIMSDPLMFYTKLCGNQDEEYTTDLLNEQLKEEFVDALQPALAVLSAEGLKPSQIPAKSKELKEAMNDALKAEWAENRGLSVAKITLNPITLTEADMKKINELEDAATVGSNPFMMAGRQTEGTLKSMEAAANNPSGAMTGFMGMGRVGMGAQSGFSQANEMYKMGVMQQQQNQQQAQSQQAPPQQTSPQPSAGSFSQDKWKCPKCGAEVSGKFCPECGTPKPEAQEGWTCSCGAVNKGKFCQNCGKPKPAGAPLYRCDKCGWEPEDPYNPPKFCPNCGDPFDDNDKR